MLKNANYQ